MVKLVGTVKIDQIITVENKIFRLEVDNSALMNDLTGGAVVHLSRGTAGFRTTEEELSTDFGVEEFITMAWTFFNIERPDSEAIIAIARKHY